MQIESLHCVVYERLLVTQGLSKVWHALWPPALASAGWKAAAKAWGHVRVPWGIWDTNTTRVAKAWGQVRLPWGIWGTNTTTVAKAWGHVRVRWGVQGTNTTRVGKAWGHVRHLWGIEDTNTTKAGRTLHEHTMCGVPACVHCLT